MKITINHQPGDVFAFKSEEERLAEVLDEESQEEGLRINQSKLDEKTYAYFQEQNHIEGLREKAWMEELNQLLKDPNDR